MKFETGASGRISHVRRLALWKLLLSLVSFGLAMVAFDLNALGLKRACR